MTGTTRLGRYWGSAVAWDKQPLPGPPRRALGRAWGLVPGLVVTSLFPGTALQAGGQRPAAGWTSARSAGTWTRWRSGTSWVPTHSRQPPASPRPRRSVAPSILQFSQSGGYWGRLDPPTTSHPPASFCKVFPWLLHPPRVPTDGLVVSHMHLHQQAHAAGLRDVQQRPARRLRGPRRLRTG